MVITESAPIYLFTLVISRLSPYIILLPPVYPHNNLVRDIRPQWKMKGIGTP